MIILSISVYLVILQISCEFGLVVLIFIAFIIYVLAIPTNIILFIIMIVKYYKGKTGEFLDFYEDCLKGEDKLMDIQNTYKKMNNLNKYMLAFVIINFIHIGLRVVDGIITYRLYKARKK